MDAYEAPQTSDKGFAPISVSARVLAMLCLVLATMGLLMTCCGGISTITTQISPQVLGMSAAELEVLQAAQAEQGWWVIPFTVLHLLAKTVLCVGLIAGSGFVVADQPNGRRILPPVLVYGMIFELVIGLWGVGYTAFNYESIGKQFGDTMAANPDLPSELGKMMGDMFGPLLAVGMVVALGWALIKVALYAATLFSLRAPETDG